MHKEQYLRAIENMNAEYINLYYSKAYRRKRRNKKIKNLIHNLEFIKLYYLLSNLVISRFIKYHKITKDIVLKKQKKSGKKVVYTCIIGRYDKLEDPLIITKNVDYIVFSDEEDVVKDLKVWKFKRIPYDIIKKAHNNPTLINRYIKMHPQEVLPDYDLSLYIDGCIKIISDIEDCFYLTNAKTGLAMHDHSKRDDVYQEARACKYSHVGNRKNIKKLVKRYQKEGFPEKFGLFEATFIACDLNNQNASLILNLWWNEFIKTNTLRDQMVFTYILWKNNYNYSDVGLLGPSASENPKFRRSEHDVPKISRKRFLKKILKKYQNKFYQSSLYIDVIMEVRKKINRHRYQGTRYECNICNSKLKRMLYGGNIPTDISRKIIGLDKRRNYKCPVCFSLDKERLIYYYIIQFTDIFQKENAVLQLNAGNELKKKFKNNKKIDYYSVTTFKNQNEPFFDITNIKFKDNTFDYIICNDFLEYIEDEKKALHELTRILKANGQIILSVPICITNFKTFEDENITSKVDRKKYFGHENYVRLYGKDLTTRLKKYNLQVQKFTLKTPQNREIRRKHGLLENGILYIIDKKRRACDE